MKTKYNSIINTCNVQQCVTRLNRQCHWCVGGQLLVCMCKLGGEYERGVKEGGGRRRGKEEGGGRRKEGEGGRRGKEGGEE